MPKGQHGSKRLPIRVYAVENSEEWESSRVLTTVSYCHSLGRSVHI